MIFVKTIFVEMIFVKMIFAKMIFVTMTHSVELVKKEKEKGIIMPLARTSS